MKFVDYRVEDNIAHVVMNRAPVNALSTELVDEILESYAAAKNDPSVRCLCWKVASQKSSAQVWI